MDFPIYRKYSNNKSFFKIVDTDHFEEIKVTGRLFEIHQFEAKILPDRNFIQDMISMDDDYWVDSTSEEFQSALDAIK